MDRVEALELMYASLPQTWRDAAMDGRLNGYHWLDPERAEVAKCLRRMKRLDADDDVPYTQVMDLLKEHCGYNYRKVGDNEKRSIRVLWASGYRLPDFEFVFKRKAKEWAGTKWAEYLRPSTLFGHFDEYRSAPDSSTLPGGVEIHRAQSGANDCPCEGANIKAAKSAAKGI